MSVESEALLQEFRQAVYEKHTLPHAALESSPDGAIQRRAEAYRAWLQGSQADGESSAIPDALLRHWVVADITSWGSVDPKAREKAVATLQHNVFAYDTYAKLLKELNPALQDQIISQSEVAETVNGFISAGSPADEPEKTDPGLILSELLKDISYRERRDGSVLYLLKNQPIFVDHGQQILMEAKAQNDELAILAALHMAKQKFGGSIELTGSDEFKRRALEVLIKHDVKVELKNPAQEALRREMIGLPPVGSADQGTRVDPAPTDAANPNLRSLSTPLESPTASSPIQGTAMPQPPAQEPINHYRGELLEFGSAPYQFDISNSRSFYVTLKNFDGESRTTWGVDLERVIDEQRVGRGDQVELTNLGRKDVTIEVPVRDKAGQVLRYEERQTHRNEWGIEVISKAPADVAPSPPFELGESAIKAHDAKWLGDMGVPADVFDTHPKMLSMRGEDHAVFLLNGIETTAEGYATVERLMAEQNYRAAFSASFDAEFGRYNGHFQQQLADSEGYAIARELLADAETKYGPIPLAVIDSEANIQDAMAKGDLDAVIDAIEAYDRQYLASLESHRQSGNSPDQADGPIGFAATETVPQTRIDERFVAEEDGEEQHLAGDSLDFVHNGQPAYIDLEQYQVPPLQSTDAAPSLAPELPVEDQSPSGMSNEQPLVEQTDSGRLTFVHQGEPAYVDLSRYEQQAPLSDEARAEVTQEVSKTFETDPMEASVPALDPAARSALEAEWNVMQYEGLKDRADNFQVIKDALIAALGARKEELDSEARTAEKSKPLSARLIGAVFGDADSHGFNQRITSINHAIQELKTDKPFEIWRSVSQSMEADLKYEERLIRAGTPMSAAAGELRLPRDEWVKIQASLRLSPTGLAPAATRFTPSSEALADAAAKREAVIADFVNQIADTSWKIHRQNFLPMAKIAIEHCDFESRVRPYSAPPLQAEHQCSQPFVELKSDLLLPAPSVHTADDLKPVNAREWWHEQRVAIESWGRSLDEMEKDLQSLGAEPQCDQFFWFDKAGQQVPPPADEAKWIKQGQASEAQKGEPDGFSNGALFQDSSIGEPKLILRGLTKIADNSFDTTVQLYQGKGDYLHGFVKVDGCKHQVLAFMNERHRDPKTGEMKPNFITLSERASSGNEGGQWNQIGHGNGVNRRGDGQEVHFDEVLFNVGGAIVKAKVTGQVDEALHTKLGFVEPRKDRDKPSVETLNLSPNTAPVNEAIAPAQSIKKRVRA
ncbi:hypothetical protein PL963_P100049 (plasmid) [Pseudomonas cerasi]|uniref:Large polyvalent protein-associated domain-containing protein n=1 Tax=Pseudomonas cerasi TaxID=1583341 RepID=A0A2K4W2H0_9PSED|nr:LPD7 domain-containing protein [Pseudomonas cerasi]SOS30032.1 hypothetical protein PL963_P100049 [Pseudomonas cerasi]